MTRAVASALALRAVVGALALLAVGCTRSPGGVPSAGSPAPKPPAAPHGEGSTVMTYDNPILPGFYPDPSICRVGSDYYLVTSTFEYFPGVPIFHSRDLVTWRQIGHALTRDSQLPLEGAKSSQGIFAPTLRHHAGTFYLVTTNVSGGGSFYVTAQDPAGEWSDPVWLPEPTFTMDPSLFFDDDGRVYYTRHGGGERGAAYQAELDLDAGQLLGPARPIWAGTGGIWPEGPHLYKFGDTYYLMLSEGGTSTGHAITVARSRSPFGPFEPNPQNPILTHSDRPAEPIQATGHGDLVQTPEGDLWLVFLGIRRWDQRHHHLGRETFLAPVTWSPDGWPVINGGGPIALEMQVDRPLPGTAVTGNSGRGKAADELAPAQALPAEHSVATHDEFNTDRLALAWNFLRNPRPGSWSLAARPGFLRLAGTSASLDAIGSPAFVGRRQRHFRARASALLDFSPGRPGQRAGLTLRANEDNHYDLSVTFADGQRVVELWKRVQGTSERVARVPAPAGSTRLEVQAFPDRYELSAGSASGPLTLVGSAPTEPLSTERAGGFTGVYIGMFATTLEGDAMPPADFDRFDYEPLEVR